VRFGFDLHSDFDFPERVRFRSWVYPSLCQEIDQFILPP